MVVRHQIVCKTIGVLLYLMDAAAGTGWLPKKVATALLKGSSGNCVGIFARNNIVHLRSVITLRKLRPICSSCVARMFRQRLAAVY